MKNLFEPLIRSTNKFNHMFYLRVFEGCNLYCEHCFIPHNPKKMSINDIRSAARLIKDRTNEGDHVLIQWHGGEPTLLGASYMYLALTELDSALENRSVSYSIQTNLMNYSSEWAVIYKKWFNSSIGVSWDPYIRHKGKPSELSNKEYESIFWENVEKLKQDDIECFMVITGTKVFFESIRDYISFFETLKERHVNAAHIERLTKTGYARDNWDRIGLTNKEYSNHMASMANAYLLYKKNKTSKNMPFLSLSPFDGLFSSVQSLREGAPKGYGCLSGSCDTTFHTIDANGYKQGCTALTAEIDNKNASNVVFFGDNLPAARQNRQISCDGCEYLPVCSSGCLAIDKDDGSGECSGGKQVFKTVDALLQYI